ncbi:hypothetical protein COO60DRAFT_1638026 [Scenedesmus sp. NREL 46B-D3]|nr:hypothetical protein COO60DRAFT_1638026 [Scenedesmus sp. NREL 46B-D3]
MEWDFLQARQQEGNSGLHDASAAQGGSDWESSKPPLNSTDCGSDVSPSRDNRRQAAYAAYARYAALKPHTPYKFGLLGPEYEIDPGMWQARAQDMQQQAAKAAQENAALLAHCHQLTSQLSSLQGLQLDNKKLLARNEQLLGNCNLLREQLGRRDELLSLQHLKQQQRRGHN